jgi:CSLREA domain-containing protein
LSPAGVTRPGIAEIFRQGRRRLLLLAVLVPVLTLAGAAAAEATTFKVNTTTDEMTPNDGKCSLREAVDAANHPGTRTDCGKANTFSNLILLRDKTTYVLSIPPVSEIPPTNGVNNTCINPPPPPPPPAPKVDENASGDLCVTSTAGLTITGQGPTTIIESQASPNDRLMTIARKASVALSALTMEGGHAPDGTAASGTCAVSPLDPVNNGANGGAVYNTGSLVTNVVTFMGNAAGAGGAGAATGTNGCTGGSGGGIYNDGTSPFPGSLTVQNTMFIQNQAGAGGAGGGPTTSVAGGKGGSGGSGGAIANDAGSVQVANASFLQNQAGGGGQGGSSAGGNGGSGGDGSPGGGIYSTGGSLSVTNGTFVGNQAGSGAKGGNGTGGGNGGNGGAGADGGALAVKDSPSGLRNATLQQNAVGTGGAGGGASGGGTGGNGGSGGTAGGIFVQASKQPDYNLTLRNTIVASSFGANCFGSPTSAITDGGHNLSFGDNTCPAVTNGDPKLSSMPADYGGFTATLALAPGSAAINQVPRNGAGCPSTDQRTVRRPQGSACDIGAFEFARPKVQIYTPRNGARYKRGARVHADFRCVEGGISSPIDSCKGTVKRGLRINTSTLGRKSFKVSATDKQGNKASKTVHYTVVR